MRWIRTGPTGRFVSIFVLSQGSLFPFDCAQGQSPPWAIFDSSLRDDKSVAGGIESVIGLGGRR